MTSHTNKNYESQLTELTSLIDELENGDVSLDDSLKLFEKGIKLANAAQKKLNLAEQKVQFLTDNNSQPAAKPDDHQVAEK